MAAGRTKFMDELMAAGGNEDDDDLTESDSDRAGRDRYDSDSASDAAEDLNLTSSGDDDDDDDDGDDDERGDDGGRGQFKGESASDDDDNEYGGTGTAGGRDGADVDIEPNEEVDDESIDLNDNHDSNRDDMDMDDDQDDEDNDDDDDDDEETEDENDDDMEGKLLNVRQVTREEFEREAQYDEEDEEIVVKEEQGVRSLFGDDDDDDDDDDDSDDDDAGDGRANINLITQEESAEEEDDASAMDSKDLSFADELMQSQAGSVDGSVVVESGEQKPLELGVHEQFEMKAAVVHIISKVSLSERRALKRGHKLEGPPVEDPIAHVDEFKRFVASSMCVYCTVCVC